MNGDVSKTLFMVALGTGVVEVDRIRNSKQLAPPIVGAVIMLAFLITIGNLWRWDIVKAFAALFMLACILTSGSAILQTFSGIIAVSGQAVAKAPAKSAPQTATPSTPAPPTTPSQSTGINKA